MAASPNPSFDAERFAALIARFDTSNPSDAEAMSAARMIRRGLIEKNMRFVDALVRADVTQALDTLLKPAREDSEELKAAFLEVTKYAELATQQAALIKELQSKVTRARIQARSGGLVRTRSIVFLALIALALMIAAEWH